MLARPPDRAWTRFGRRKNEWEPRDPVNHLAWRILVAMIAWQGEEELPDLRSTRQHAVGLARFPAELVRDRGKGQVLLTERDETVERLRQGRVARGRIGTRRLGGLQDAEDASRKVGSACAERIGVARRRETLQLLQEDEDGVTPGPPYASS
jgi:hypothetical protein